MLKQDDYKVTSVKQLDDKIKRFANLKTQIKELEAAAKQEQDEILQEMATLSVLKIDGDSLTATVVQGTNFKPTGEVEDKFLKSVLNNEAIRNHIKEQGATPQNVEQVFNNPYIKITKK